MKKGYLRIGAAALLLAAILGLTGPKARAWLQLAHVEVNAQAAQNFEKDYRNRQKYRDAAFNLDALCEAPQVSSSGLFSGSYRQSWTMGTALQHIIHGGFSADEPNVYVSMKHFYDPLALSGKHELSDQSSVHGWVYDSIPANVWGLTDKTNPYSLANAMLNYKKSMEIPSDASVQGIPSLGDFRDTSGSPQTVEDMRSMYLGKSLRGAGEVMHLVADMAQPAHVRNDSHPAYEITETAVEQAVAQAAVRLPRIDGLPQESFGSDINDIMIAVSTYTNANFYSEDTIASGPLLTPKNGEKAYPHPNLDDFKKKKTDTGTQYYRLFGGVEIPMLWKYSGWTGPQYQIPAEYAQKQANVLQPLAAYACELALDRFLPTLALRCAVETTEPDEAILARAKQQGAQTVKQYETDITLKHDVSRDPDWQKAGLEIKYSGPGQLYITRDGRHTKLTDLEFKDGKAVQYQDADTGEMTDGQPTFYLPLGAEKKVSLAGKAIDYTVELGDSFYVAVSSGARIMASDTYVFAQDAPQIKLTADKTRAMPGDKIEFHAEIENAPERYQIEWLFGDDASATNRKMKMTHAYAREDEFTATVRLIDTKRKACVAQDSAPISVYLGDLAGAWQIDMSVEQESKLFVDMIKGLLKGIVRYIISPIAEALELGPVPEDSIDKLTFTGTVMQYSAELRKTSDDPLVYEGPLTPEGSNNGMLEASGDLQAIRLTMEGGKMRIIAIGKTDSGAAAEIELLKNAHMTDAGIEGDWEIPGVMGGSWIATKK